MIPHALRSLMTPDGRHPAIGSNGDVRTGSGSLLSDRSIRQERLRIQSKWLGPELDHWVQEYGRLGTRPRYIWQWCLHGAELTTLPCVESRFRGHLCGTKLLAGMFNVLLDDVVDRFGNGALFRKLVSAIRGGEDRFDSFAPVMQDYAAFVLKVWTTCWDRAQQYPQFAVFRELLDYDLQQLLNQIHYSYLTHRDLHLLNRVEHDLYAPHGMMLLPFSTLDLMCSPSFRRRELGKLREAMWHGQCMARIGNLLSTWRRETAERDFTSGVFVRAVEGQEISVAELQEASPSEIQKAIDSGGHEEHFLCKWQEHRRNLCALKPEFQSFDLAELVRGLDRLLLSELVSQGRK